MERDECSLHLTAHAKYKSRSQWIGLDITGDGEIGKHAQVVAHSMSLGHWVPHVLEVCERELISSVSGFELEIDYVVDVFSSCVVLGELGGLVDEFPGCTVSRTCPS